MRTPEIRSTIAFVTLALSACNSSTSPSAVDAAIVDQTQSISDASSWDLSSANDMPNTTGHHASIPTGSCFSFATGTYDSSNPCTSGELYTLSGENVDLSSGGSTSTLCLLAGPFTGLAQVPRDYTSCAWTNYVEGINGLANEGLIVRDSTGAHHYRVFIDSNTQPNLVIDWDTID